MRGKKKVKESKLLKKISGDVAVDDQNFRKFLEAEPDPADMVRYSRWDKLIRDETLWSKWPLKQFRYRYKPPPKDDRGKGLLLGMDRVDRRALHGVVRVKAVTKTHKKKKSHKSASSFAFSANLNVDPAEVRPKTLGVVREISTMEADEIVRDLSSRTESKKKILPVSFTTVMTNPKKSPKSLEERAQHMHALHQKRDEAQGSSRQLDTEPIAVLAETSSGGNTPVESGNLG